MNNYIFKIPVYIDVPKWRQTSQVARQYRIYMPLQAAQVRFLEKEMQPAPRFFSGKSHGERRPGRLQSYGVAKSRTKHHQQPK